MFLWLLITAKLKKTDKSWIIETFPNFLIEYLAMLIGLGKTAVEQKNLNLFVFSIKKEKKKRPVETFLAAADKIGFQPQLPLISRWLFQ